MHGHGGPGFGGGEHLFHGDFIQLIVVGILLIVGGLYLTKLKPKAAQAEDNAILILKEQFAKGEIDEETFAARKAVLEG
jgi:uncharacterized membrane protein